MQTEKLEINVIDNFYDNVDEVLKIINFDKTEISCGAATKSLPLNNLSPELWKIFKNKIYKMFNLNPLTTKLHTFFYHNTHNNIDDIIYEKNLKFGFTHMDGKNPNYCIKTGSEYNILKAGTILLSSNLNYKMYFEKLKESNKWTEKEKIDNLIDKYDLPKKKLIKEEINIQEYIDLYNQHQNNFDTHITIKQEFNRMISWSGGNLHNSANMTSKIYPICVRQLFFITNYDYSNS